MHVDECTLFRFGLGVYGMVCVRSGRIDCPSCTAHLPAVLNRVCKVACKGGMLCRVSKVIAGHFLLLGFLDRVSSFVL